MSRNFADWLSAYVEYAGFGEAPQRMHYWSGMSALAGALRRRVWIDQKHFLWHPNLYIILVAPPAVVSKSTTAGIAMQLLKQVPGVKFGPNVVTWPALCTAFAASRDAFEYKERVLLQCALTLESSEFGNLVNPGDREMIDLLVELYDSRTGTFEKVTKTSGTDKIVNPWLNLIACTTPAWIAGNFPEYVISGGFTSRCLFVYAEEKERLIAYPDEYAPPDFEAKQALLVADLTHISTALLGEYVITPEARAWGREWYEHHWKHKPIELDDDRFTSYLGRKYTHLNKVAMLIAASRSDELLVLPEHYAAAHRAITGLEADMPKVFARIGRTEHSVQAERFIRYVQQRRKVPYTEAYHHVHSSFPDLRAFEQVVFGAVKAGFMEMLTEAGEIWLKAR